MKFPQKGVYFLFDPLSWEKKPWRENITDIFPHISALQLRSPDLFDREFFKAALFLKKKLEFSGIPLIINNRVDIALCAGADGIHLGREDIPAREARKIFSGILGLSGHTPEAAVKAEKEGASYIGCGPLFHTSTKSMKRDIIGIEGFKRVTGRAGIQVVPVGGINAENIRDVSAVSSIAAVSSAVNLSENPADAAGKIKKILELNI